VISTARTAEEVAASRSASAIAAYMARVRAFFLSGRAMRMVRNPASSVTSISTIVSSVGRQAMIGGRASAIQRPIAVARSS